MIERNFQTRLQGELTAGIQAMHEDHFFRDLQAQTLARDDYLAFLRCLMMVQAFFEGPLEGGMPGLWEKFRCFSPQLTRIRHDLDALDADLGPDAVEPVQLTYELLFHLRAKSVPMPGRAPITLWALEALRLDLQAILPVSGPGIPGQAWTWLNHAAESEDLRWNSFMAVLAAEFDLEVSGSAFMEAATEMLSGLRNILKACHGSREKKHLYLASSLNPEAGLHAIPQNEEELRIAIRIADELMERLPYVSRRYGERGRAFTTSDAAWQIHLTHLSYATMLDQLKWLLGLLARRGMPSHTVILKLDALEAELVRTNPQERARYQKLGQAARYFEEKNAKILSTEHIEVIKEECFHQQADELGVDFASILATAVMDECQGHEGAEATLRDWLTRETPASAAYIEASLAMLAAVKALCHRGPSS